MSQSQRPSKKATFSAHKGGLSVQELKQMTAKRMAEGGSGNNHRSFHPQSGTGCGYQPEHNHRHHDAQPPYGPVRGASPSMKHSSPSPNHHVHLAAQSPMEKGLSVQELKARTRLRLAREAGSNSGNISNSNHQMHPFQSSPQAGRAPGSHEKRIEDYVPQHSSFLEQQKLPRHGVNSGSTSPTVDSSDTGSTETDHLPYRLRHHASPISHASSSVYSVQSPPAQGYLQNSDNGFVDGLDSFDPILLPPRRPMEYDPYSTTPESEYRAYNRRTRPSSQAPAGIHPGLHEKLLKLEAQRNRREQEQLDNHYPKFDPSVNRDRYFPSFEHQNGRPVHANEVQKRNIDGSAMTLTLDIPSNTNEENHQSQTATSANITSSKTYHHDSSLRKMVLNKTVHNNNSHGETNCEIDSSLLPSNSPFCPSSMSGSSQAGANGLSPPDLEPSPPASPRSFRNAMRKPLSLSCPAPLRRRSSSDCNDLAQSVAESVLLTPTTQSPAASFRKGALSPSSRSSSRSGLGVMFSEIHRSDTNANDSVASGGTNSLIDSDNPQMTNLYSLDSNDEFLNGLDIMPMSDPASSI